MQELISAVDSSVLLDVVCNDARHAPASEALLRDAMREGCLVACECVVAELRPALPGDLLSEFLADWRIEFVPCTLEVAMLAGSHFAEYMARGGRAGRIVADFLIGAHAQLLADRLLARDRGCLRDYFRDLTVRTAL